MEVNCQAAVGAPTAGHQVPQEDQADEKLEEVEPRHDGLEIVFVLFKQRLQLLQPRNPRNVLRQAHQPAQGEEIVNHALQPEKRRAFGTCRRIFIILTLLALLWESEGSFLIASMRMKTYPTGTQLAKSMTNQLLR